MLNWLANALATRITRADTAKIDAALEQLEKERKAARTEVRALVAEMDDMLERFSRVVARQAMRRSRANKAALEEADAAADAPPPAQETAPPLSAADRKTLLRQRLRAGGLRMPRGGGDE